MSAGFNIKITNQLPSSSIKIILINTFVIIIIS